MASEQDVFIFSTEDCPPVDDFIKVEHDESLEIPEDLTPTSYHGDHFFIAMEVDVLFVPKDEDEEVINLDYETWENRSVYLEFWSPCKHVRRGNLPERRIAEMLSKVGVPECKRKYLAARIGKAADKIAAMERNMGLKAIPMSVTMDLIACECMDVHAWPLRRV